jgi:predicted small secreted protein
MVQLQRPSGRPPEKTMRKLIILAAIAASLTVAACNTVEGAGKDVSSAGHAVSDTAKDAK